MHVNCNIHKIDTWLSANGILKNKKIYEIAGVRPSTLIFDLETKDLHRKN